MDFITDLPLSAGHTTIFVVVDLFSKMAHFVPCVGVPSAKETARLFLHHIFRLHGWPDGIVSDRGAQFTARFWRSLLHQLGIQSHLSSAFHPQSDGQTERTNRTLEQYLRCYVNYQQDDWADLLPLAEFAYNNAVHSSTQQTPFRANYGHDPRPFPAVGPPSSVPATDQWLQELQAAQALLREQLCRAKEDYKAAADANRQSGPSIGVGDRVWLSTRHLPRKRPCRKLDARYIGPYTVIAVINPVAFRLQLPRGLRIHPVFHRSLLVLANDVRPDAGAAPPPPVLVDGEEEYEVAQILDSRWHRRRLQYFVDWVGYGPEERSWEDAADVHAPDLVRSFHDQYPAKPNLTRGPGGSDRGEGSGVKPRRSGRLQGIPPQAVSVFPEDESSDEEGENVYKQQALPESAEESALNSDLPPPPPPTWFRAQKEKERRKARICEKQRATP